MTKKVSKSLIFIFALILLFAVSGISLLSSTFGIASAYGVTSSGLKGNQNGSDTANGQNILAINSYGNGNANGSDSAILDNSSVAFSSSDAEVAGIWGDKDAEKLWYFGEKFVDLKALKTLVKGWELAKVSKDNPIIVAVIDTGLNINHEIFKDVLLKNKDGQVLGYNSYNAVQKVPGNLGDITDNKDAHGSAVASVIAMMIKELGVENYIKIYPIKASYTGKDEISRFSIEAVTEGIRWANEKMGASVINLSLGLLQSDMKETNWAENKPLKSAVIKASQKGIVVGAAGNSGKDSAGKDSKYYPASLDGVLSVMGYDDASKKAVNSNYGAYDLIAPGKEIWTGGNVVGDKSSYKLQDGTSFAAPFVSMSAALLKLMFLQKPLTTPAGVIGTPSASAMARMLKNQGTKVAPSEVFIAHGTYKLRVLKLNELLTADYASDDAQYSKPNGIDIVDNGILDKDDSCILRTDSQMLLELSATLTPIGETDPDIDISIEWWIHEMDETQVVKSQLVAKGKNFDFVPIIGGAFTIEARVKIDGETYEKEVTVTVVYQAYVSGDVRVTLANQADRDVKDAVGRIKMYTTEHISLSLTGVKFVDRTKVVKWFVNNELAGTGYTFDFAPKKTGSYVVSAEYNGQTIAYDNNLFVEVKSFAARPADLATIIIVSLLAVGVTATAIAIVQKKKAMKKTNE